MRRILQAGKAVVVALLVILCAVFALYLSRAPVFEQGEGYELSYGQSSSAKTERTETPFLDKLIHGTVAGESVRYRGDRYEKLKAQFSAELLFTEESNGVVNYYLYSPRIAGGVQLYGKTVNLHIAVGSEQTAAGTPLIFGGF